MLRTYPPPSIVYSTGHSAHSSPHSAVAHKLIPAPVASGASSRVPSSRSRSYLPRSHIRSDGVFQESVARFLSVKQRPFAVSGTLPLSTVPLTLFFHTESAESYCLPFPIDPTRVTPRALNALIASCEPARDSSTSSAYSFTTNASALVFPRTLPLATSLDISNHPVLDVIRNILFPHAQPGEYLVAARSNLQVHTVSGSTSPRRDRVRGDGKVATIVVGLPVKHRGGALVVRSPNGDDEYERYYMSGVQNNSVEWAAFLSDCEYEVEPVEEGVRMAMTYDVFIRSYGTYSNPNGRLLVPNDGYLDALSQLLNAARGLTLGFYLTGQYDIQPSEVLADYHIPLLRGADAALYEALKAYKLKPELRYAAGGYIWPADKVAALGEGSSLPRAGYPYPSRSRHSSDTEEDEIENLATQLEDGGAMLLSQAGVTLLAGQERGAITKERVPFVAQGRLNESTLDFLYVNVVFVVFVP